MYQMPGGPWLSLGSQEIAQTDIGAVAAWNNPVSATPWCTGLKFDFTDNGNIGISYAVVTGNGLPAGGVLIFKNASGKLRLAAGARSTYNGTATAALDISGVYGTGVSAPGTIYPLADPAIQSIQLFNDAYTVNLYNDNGTPSNLADDTLLGTITVHLPARPMLNTFFDACMFAASATASPALLSAASTGATSALSWTPAVDYPYFARAVYVVIASAGTPQTASEYLSATTTSVAQFPVPQVASPTQALLVIQYGDALLRQNLSFYTY